MAAANPPGIRLQRLIYALALLAMLWLGWTLSQPAPSPPLRGSDGSLHMDGYRITPLQPFSIEARVLGREDEGIKIAMFALDQGRYTVAAGATGLIRACRDASVTYARER